MWTVERDFAVKFGGNLYIRCGQLVTYEGEPLFNLARRESDGRLGIDFDVYDDRGAKLATVRHGSIVQGDAKRFDIHHGADVKTMTDRETGEILVRINRRPSSVAEFIAKRKATPLPPDIAE